MSTESEKAIMLMLDVAGWSKSVYDLKIDEADLPKQVADPHITILARITEGDDDYVRKFLDSVDLSMISQAVISNEVSVFEGPDFDVLKLDVLMPKQYLYYLHSYSKYSFDNKWEFSNYTPHVTAATVRSGAGNKYAGLPFVYANAPITITGAIYK